MMQDKLINSGNSQKHELKGVSCVVDRYDVFIIDLWGVIYDGKRLFPVALKVLEKLKEQGKEVYLVTNNPRSSKANIAKLESLGLPRELYKDMITAGQKTLDLLRTRVIGHQLKRPIKTFIIDDINLCDWIDAADLVGVDNIDDADLVLSIHMSETQLVPDAYVPLFKKAIERDLLHVCANPDKYVMLYTEKKARVGILTDLYKALGGRVVEVGKPHPIMFEDVMTHHHGKSILLIGDSLVTDILAAKYIGVDSLLILLGYHREEFFLNNGATKEAIYQRYGVSPTYVCEQLFW